MNGAAPAERSSQHSRFRVKNTQNATPGAKSAAARAFRRHAATVAADAARHAEEFTQTPRRVPVGEPGEREESERRGHEPAAVRRG